MNSMLFLGPPGTGKTTKLLGIVEALLKSGVNPQEIAYCSFTKRAAEEAISRAVSKFGMERGQFRYFKTLHALAYSVLSVKKGRVVNKKHLDEISQLSGFEITGSFSVMDGMPSRNNPGNQYLFISNLARSKIVSLEEQWYQMSGVGKYDIDINALKYFSDIYDTYRADKQVLDFTDMLEICISEDRTVPVKYVILDEAQDLSKLQWVFAMSIFRNAEVMFIAGDDDQAIHAWAGADVDHFLNLKCRREVLRHSFRLSAPVHRLANKISSSISTRFPKEWESAGHDGIVEYINEPAALPLDNGESWFLLARNVYVLPHIAKLMEASGVIYTIKGDCSVKKEHIIAIKTWRELVKGEKVTPNHARIMLDYTSQWDPEQCQWNKRDKSLVTYRTLTNRHGLKTDPAMTWQEALDLIPYKMRRYYELLRERGIELDSPPSVVIDTIHGVKGGEADNVVLFTDMAMNTYHGYLTDPDIEHRVFYVGATRAKKRLFIVDRPIISKNRYIHL